MFCIEYDFPCSKTEFNNNFDLINLNRMGVILDSYPPYIHSIPEDRVWHLTWSMIIWHNLILSMIQENLFVTLSWPCWAAQWGKHINVWSHRRLWASLNSKYICFHFLVRWVSTWSPLSPAVENELWWVANLPNIARQTRLLPPLSTTQPSLANLGFRVRPGKKSPTIVALGNCGGCHNLEQNTQLHKNPHMS